MVPTGPGRGAAPAADADPGTPGRRLLADAVGDRRTINQPGTIDEYPNWRVPLADGDGRPVQLEDIVASDRARSLIGAIANRRR